MSSEEQRQAHKASTLGWNWHVITSDSSKISPVADREVMADRHSTPSGAGAPGTFPWQRGCLPGGVKN